MSTSAPCNQNSRSLAILSRFESRKKQLSIKCLGQELKMFGKIKFRNNPMYRTVMEHRSPGRVKARKSVAGEMWGPGKIVSYECGGPFTTDVAALYLSSPIWAESAAISPSKGTVASHRWILVWLDNIVFSYLHSAVSSLHLCSATPNFELCGCQVQHEWGLPSENGLNDSLGYRLIIRGKHGKGWEPDSEWTVFTINLHAVGCYLG